MLAHAFAAKTVVGLEPILVGTLSTFMKQMDKRAAAGTQVNMRLMLNYFTIDLFGNLLYGHKLGCLERENDLLDAEFPRDGRIYKVPIIQSLLDATVVNTVLAFAPKLLPITKPLLNYHPYKKKGTDWENIVYHNTKERMANPAPGDDLFKKLLQDSKGQELNLPLGGIIAECSAMMNAGTKTTTAAMTNTVYLLYTHPHVLAKLRAEIDTDRWMTGDSENKHRMMTNHLPFSTGPRACIGRNIAYFEQIVVIATLAKFYDCIVPTGFKLETQERFNSNPGPLVVEVMPRRKE
ncbi:hypothetical protein NW759_016388 [Fusarium solani]|nr:hypothetical protein NW759_016388 [Fusarium solani]